MRIDLTYVFRTPLTVSVDMKDIDPTNDVTKTDIGIIVCVTAKQNRPSMAVLLFFR